MQFNSFEDLVKPLMQAMKKLDVSLQLLKQDGDAIKHYYNPRTEFNRWRSSEEGQLWKQQQYKRQEGRCANPSCNKLIELKGSHIDHIKPISKFPQLNLDTRNLRLTCAPCNYKKGNQY